MNSEHICMGHETENCILDLDIDFLQETNS